MDYEEKWERNYQLLLEYYKKNGDTRVPRNYIVDGVRLGCWVHRQRDVYRSKNSSTLTQEKIDKLNKLGVFDNHYQQHTFDYYYSLLEEYYKEHGNINLPANYEVNGVKLGSWLAREKHAYKIDKKRKLTDEQLNKLTKLGLSLSITNIFSFEYYYSLLKDYRKKYGNIDVPLKYEIDGIKLGRWLSNKRSAYNGHIVRTITEDEIDKLNKLGMTWCFCYKKWTENYKLVEKYHEKYGNIDIPYDYVSNGIYLGYWLNMQRKLYNEKSPKLAKNRIFKLNQLGIDWEEENTELLNKSIDNMQIYNSILNERVNYVLRDLTIEKLNEINTRKKQKQIENELIKRIWR